MLHVPHGTTVDCPSIGFLVSPEKMCSMNYAENQNMEGTLSALEEYVMIMDGAGGIKAAIYRQFRRNEVLNFGRVVS